MQAVVGMEGKRQLSHHMVFQRGAMSGHIDYLFYDAFGKTKKLAFLQIEQTALRWKWCILIELWDPMRNKWKLMSLFDKTSLFNKLNYIQQDWNVNLKQWF